VRYRRMMVLSSWLVAGVALAQVPPSSASDWTLQPAPSASGDYRAGARLVPGASGSSPFRFSDGREGSVLNKPPPQATDRDAVLGTGRPWLGGRPPLDCAMTPLDARCH